MPRPKQPHLTRQRILEAAFREFRRRGFHMARLEAILEQATVTKGALYHYFPSKLALGYAVVEEVVGDWITERWVRPVASADDPVAALVALASWGRRAATPESLVLGCPLNNLSQEMSSHDEGFRARLTAVYDRWREGLARALAAAQRGGKVRDGVDVEAAAAFIVAVWEGAIALAKTDGNPVTLGACQEGLEAYLQTLRPSHTSQPSEPHDDTVRWQSREG